MVERIACRYSFLGGPPQIRALVRQSERSQKITRPGKLGARQAERKLALERTAKGFRGEKKLRDSLVLPADRVHGPVEHKRIYNALYVAGGHIPAGRWRADLYQRETSEGWVSESYEGPGT
jgi:hypothetical protein